MLSKEKKKNLYNKKISPQEIITLNSFGVDKQESYYYSLKNRFKIQVNSFFNKTPGILLSDLITLRDKLLEEINEDIYECLNEENKKYLLLEIQTFNLKKEFEAILNNIDNQEK